jgi:phosphatidylglycerophosphatase B
MHRPIDLAASIGFAALLYALVPAIPHEKIEPYVPDWFKSFRAFN